MGASCGDAREGAGLPAGPAGSVSQAAQRRGGGDAGPPRTILTAARPAARAPATRFAAAGARASPPPTHTHTELWEGAEPAAGARGGSPGEGAAGEERALEDARAVAGTRAAPRA